ncbi:MAG: acyl carrier protein [Candidatus Electrothrix sp. GW3-4]|uniref:acyl carrier protein n=1 Tax=Candidatus Electrothrix sp. GW3-4 TaxID=3126740 RepID=UPI0030CCE639
MSKMKTEIRAFIFENFLFDAEEDALQNDASFLEQGIIDSTGVLELVEWIEEEFGFTVGDEEIVPENFDSVNLLCDYLAQKTEKCLQPT